mmetsp:Transcript_14083/g.23626  ORF Transcript_14083/g.23626 Transcript_14083/m.23626 type:complete len:90 (+) Transcript_14083:158-427(+)
MKSQPPPTSLTIMSHESLGSQSNPRAESQGCNLATGTDGCVKCLQSCKIEFDNLPPSPPPSHCPTLPREVPAQRRTLTHHQSCMRAAHL